jgi:hypothetical protein
MKNYLFIKFNDINTDYGPDIKLDIGNDGQTKNRIMFKQYDRHNKFSLATDAALT